MEITSITCVWSEESKDRRWEAGRRELGISIGFITYISILNK